MTISATAIDHAKELFSPFGEIRVRKMFGGAGVYCDDLFFAIMDGDAIYLKVDDQTRAGFEARGLTPFVFEMKDGATGEMNYFNAPEDIYDDEDELRRWTTLALDAARR
ncbi:MAG: TfoX/Sxy family protein, partial [Parvularculaceae bacterium]|nr:TfoX/Sxy family protein [Parvularculaceae bacterium]